MLDRDAVRAEVASPTYLGAVQQHTGVALVDRARSRSAARAAIALGVRLYERTRSQRDGRRLTTPAGSVRARRVLLATGAYPRSRARSGGSWRPSTTTCS